jgi:RNA polymerase primary sigma factor
MNRLFKMAVTAGVENAVQIHIDRGDNLNARDEKGHTPLMLSAARNRVGICKLLLAAGADAGLLDPLGRDALRIAQAAGALEAASAIEAACASRRFENAGIAPAEPTLAANEDLAEFIVLVSEPELAAPELEREVVVDGDGFDLAGWEAEEEQTPPEGDATLAVAAVEIQTAITEHQPLDTSADWDDFEAFLPDRATPLPRADDAEARERLRLVLLRALREGSVPQSLIDDLTRGDDGAPDAGAAAMLGMVINDLGAETDERFEYSAPHESFEVHVSPEEEPDEEDAVAEALAFVDDLAAGRNEPLRLYQREIQREALLTAEAEVALGQAMERGIEHGLDALVSWPSGLGAVVKAAREVADGAKPLRWISSGPPVEAQVAELAPIGIASGADADAELELPAEGEPVASEEEPDSEFGLDAKESSDELAEFCANAELLSGLAVDASQHTPEWKARRGALASLGLTRGFLMELAESGLAGEPEPARAFAQAMRTCRLARDKMTVANLKLVYSIAKKYLFSGQPLDDLLQEGNIGLLKAVDRYDWRKGFKFSTYATWWIRQQVGRFVADKGKTIRLPVHVYEKTQRIAQAARAYELRQGHAPSLEQIAALVEMPVEKVVALSRLGVEPLPIHDLADIDGQVAADAKDRLTARDPMEIVADMQLADSVDRLLSTLKVKEANIVRMRNGIGVQDAMTLEEIGAVLDVTRERIRQIEAKALRKLKHPSRLDRLLLELGLDPTPKPQRNADAQSDPDDGADDDAPGVAEAAEPKSDPGTPALPQPEQQTGPEPTALGQLLE